MGKRLRKVAHLRSEPVVGQRYRVLVCKNNFFSDGILPLLGPAHDDNTVFEARDCPKKLIVPEAHFHPDLRFISDVDTTRLADNDAEKAKWNLIHVPFAWEAIFRSGMCSSPFYMNLICLRRMPRWRPSNGTSASNMLEPLYENQRMDLRKKTCPHFGTHLGNLPCFKTSAGQDAVVCPAHGLAWGLKDGSMVPQAAIQDCIDTEPKADKLSESVMEPAR